MQETNADLKLIELDDGTEQWFEVADLCAQCEDAPAAPPQGDRREVEALPATLCEECQSSL